MTPIKSILAMTALLVSFAGGACAQNLITFQVDMSIAIERGLFDPSAGDTIVVRGSFNDWAGNAYPVPLQVRPALYGETYELPGSAGSVVQFKFVIVSQRLGEIWEWRPLPDNTDHGNRTLILTGNPATIPGTSFDLGSHARSDSPSFSVQDLLEDFRQLRSVIEGSHPALNVFTSETAFDSLYEVRSRLITRPMTADEFYTVAAPVVARIGCGHSRLWMPEGYWGEAPPRFFPMKLKFLNGKAYALKYYGKEELLEPGSEIVAIDGVPVTEIVRTLMEGVSGDGFNRGNRLDRLERRFHLVYALYYGYPKEFRVSCRPVGGGDIQVQILPSVSIAVIGGGFYPKPLLAFQVLERESIAVITMNNFNSYDDLERYERFIDDAFDRIDRLGIRNLILDLRDNDGGDPFSASYLLSYLTPKQITYFAKPYFNYISLALPLSPKENRFTGKLYTLINERCFSTTGHLSALMKYHQIGTFVGSETGGTYTCNDAVNVTTLENTQIQAQIARATFRVEVQEIRRDGGIEPEYNIEPKIEDIVDGTDTVKEFLLSLIADSN